MPEFFLELFSEEIPARMQASGYEELRRICQTVFKELHWDQFQYFVGSRRIAVKANIKAETRGAEVEVRGPRDTAPDVALSGFLTKNNATRDEVVADGGYFWLRRNELPVTAATIIKSFLEPALSRFSWPKSMRWGQSGDFAWVRPLRRIICLLDTEVVPITVGPVKAGDETEGHRFMAPGSFQISSCEDWLAKLQEHYVKVNINTDELLEGLKTAAAPHALSLAEDQRGLLNEVAGLVEWPVPLIGKIGAEFMDLPPEVRELSMKVNQKYFALRDAAGKPAPYFAFISNIEATDGGATIIAGNERVLRARLSDARYFWDLDLKTPLDTLLPKLDKITFHAKIGTQGQRVKRIAALALRIADALGAASEECKQAEYAGLLSKADLVTGMVGEFPELQGVMGGYYAEQNPSFWNGSIVGPAIKTHYQPKGPNDAVPAGIVAVSVALADKLDTLVEFFNVGEKPTGSGDPYALRRAALGVIRIILENNLSLRLTDFLNGNQELFNFILERLRVKLRGEGQRFDVLDAVIGAKFDDDLASIMQRVDAVKAFLLSTEGVNLLIAYRRAANILRIEDAKDGPYTYNGMLGPLGSIEADSLEYALDEIIAFIGQYLRRDFAQILEFLARLRAPVDAFFDNVTVNAPDPELRRNRLQLLAKLRDTMHLIADFSKIEG